MSNQTLRLPAAPAALPADRPRLPLGRHLVESGVISADQLVRALRMQLRLGAPIGEILVSEGWAASAEIRAALARQHGIQQADLSFADPEPRLCALKPPEFWLRHQAIPWIRLGRTVLLATARPDRLARLREELGETLPEILPVLASEAQIHAAITKRFAQPLARAASSRVAPEFSCRTWRGGHRFSLLFLLLAFGAAALLAPLFWLSLLSLAAVSTLFLFAALKLMGFLGHLLSHGHLTAPRPPPRRAGPHRRPKVSVLVPLYREREIAGALIDRLQRLSYPKALLDVILVIEEHDTLTRDTLRRTALPPWMRVAQVPAHGGLTTKPRALNYALDFCRGEIIGVWDAEDAPAEDQIEHVVARFAEADDDVVCLQGILDYYNPRTNWLARCFTIEYASWFRIVLPGIARLGLVVPLGGTTFFIRRRQLEELGGWDAHNVTEDADLGVRLSRAGYRTELIETVTYEEANCRLWPWIKQRSRWLKGFMVTYLVHMRSPRRLLRELGPWRFCGLQAFFLGTLGQFLLAPVLWSFWLILAGLPHPVAMLAPDALLSGAVALFLLTELLAICIGIAAVSRPGRRFLIPWVPSLILYFPLGTVAAYKALIELLLCPYYWDKTQHGRVAADDPPG